MHIWEWTSGVAQRGNRHPWYGTVSNGQISNSVQSDFMSAFFVRSFPGRRADSPRPHRVLRKHKFTFWNLTGSSVWWMPPVPTQRSLPIPSVSAKISQVFPQMFLTDPSAPAELWPSLLHSNRKLAQFLLLQLNVCPADCTPTRCLTNHRARFHTRSCPFQQEV